MILQLLAIRCLPITLSRVACIDISFRANPSSFPSLTSWGQHAFTPNTVSCWTTRSKLQSGPPKTDQLDLHLRVAGAGSTAYFVFGCWHKTKQSLNNCCHLVGHLRQKYARLQMHLNCMTRALARHVINSSPIRKARQCSRQCYT